MVTLSSQSSHGLERGAIQAPLNAMEVGPPGDDCPHDLTVAGCDDKVVCILPTNRSTGGVETYRRRLPPQAIAQRPEVAHRASASAAFGGISPLGRRRWPT
eukprot:4132075-Amphidinium_carterae.3